MNGSFFKAALLLMLGGWSMTGQAAEPDSVVTRHDRFSQKRTMRWERLIPDYGKVQFAGGMGMLSFGPGWDYGKKRQWETDFFVGFLPGFADHRATATITLKQNYVPWKLRPRQSGKVIFEPLTTGIYMNKLLSNDFWTKEPSKYGGPYYRFATGIRFSAFVGQRVALDISHWSVFQSACFFYEFSSNDLYIISKFTNSTLKVSDILVLSFGMKLQFD